MNHFVLNYQGNKYLEAKKYFNGFDFSKYDIIAEPFCGIFGFSRYAYEKGFKGEFLLNDISGDLIETLNDIKNDSKAFCNNITNELNKYTCDSELSRHKETSTALRLVSMGNCPRLCNIKRGYTKINNFLKKETMYNDFFKQTKFFNLSADDFIEKLPKDKKILIFYDPPYFNSCNVTYGTHIKPNDDGYRDGSYIYIDIFNNFKNTTNMTHDHLLIMNHIDVLHYIFKDYFTSQYTGRYQNNGKTIKKHNIYSRYNI